MAGWWWFSERAQGSRGRDHLLALGSLGGGGLLLLALSGWAGLPGGALGTWLGWADLPLLGGPMSPERMRFVLLVAALLLANLATGNIVVRLVLVAIGALRPGARVGTQPADRIGDAGFPLPPAHAHAPVHANDVSAGGAARQDECLCGPIEPGHRLRTNTRHPLLQ